MENEFPPNSHAKREARPERRTEKPSSDRKEVRQVTKGKALVRKKPLRKKFFDAFRPEDNVGLVEHLLLEVLVPSIKDAISYAGTEAIESALGTNGTSRSRRRSGGGSGYTSYSRMSTSKSRDRRDRDDDRRGGRRDVRRADDSREVILESRVEAEEVLDNLIELISMYDAATMRDLLSLIGEPHNATHEDWGWTDLRGARIHRVGQQSYLLDLPRVEALD